MSFGLEVDAQRWEGHQRSVLAQDPGTVPVIKGNGYGFGRQVLARRAAALGVDTVAVGVDPEVASVREHHAGDVLVMDPLRPGCAGAAGGLGDERVVRTVSHLEVLREVAALARNGRAPRVVVELDSPVHRHGIGWEHLAEVGHLLEDVAHAGLSVHLPMRGDNVAVTAAALERLAPLGRAARALWVSHLPPGEASRLAAAGPAGIPVRVRTGTRLWLGDRGAARAAGTVLEARPVRRGETVGYRQRRLATSGTLLVVAGGTDHGVGMEGPRSRRGARGWARGALRDLAGSVGALPSPFRWDGRRLAWADTPHMQVSMLVVPPGVRPPVLGQRLRCEVRMTTSTFDEVRFLGAERAVGEAVGLGR